MPSFTTGRLRIDCWALLRRNTSPRSQVVVVRCLEFIASERRVLFVGTIESKEAQTHDITTCYEMGLGRYQQASSARPTEVPKLALSLLLLQSSGSGQRYIAITYITICLRTYEIMALGLG